MTNLTNYIESEGSKTIEVQTRIVKYRKHLNITQGEIATMLNIPRSTYAYLEKKASKLSIDFVDKVAAALKISTNLLWNGEIEKDTTVIGEPPPLPVPIKEFPTTNSEQKIIEKFRLLPPEARKEIKKLVDNLYNEFKIKK